MEGAIVLYFIRHGEAEDNAKRVLAGSNDSKLTERGRAQSQRVATELLSRGILDYLLSSKLQRASETAGVIGKVGNVQVEECEDLRERSFGDKLEGVSYEEYAAIRARKDRTILDEMETQEQMTERATRFIHKELVPRIERTRLTNSYNGNPRMAVAVAIVTHGAFIRCLWPAVQREMMNDKPIVYEPRDLALQGTLEDRGFRMSFTGIARAAIITDRTTIRSLDYIGHVMDLPGSLGGMRGKKQLDEYPGFSEGERIVKRSMGDEDCFYWDKSA